MDALIQKEIKSAFAVIVDGRMEIFVKAKYYDPLFYISSDKMPFTIRIEVELEEKILEKSLRCAVDTAMPRYPYFAVRIVKKDGEYLEEHNDKPVPTYFGADAKALGKEDTNGHLLSLSYFENKIFFYVSHVITDGGGFFPFIKTVLYYYLCDRYQTVLDPDGINLKDDPFFDDETGNPFDENKMKNAAPFCQKKLPEYFRLKSGGYVCDHKSTVFRLSLSEEEVMRFNYDNDGSPCALLSSLMAKAIQNVHPDEKKDIVSAVSFNLRPGLGNRHSYRMLCSAIMLDYPDKTRGTDITKMCTCSRGMTMLQSQPENVIFYAASRKKRVEKLLALPDIEEKKRILGDEALKDSISNTFSVSYVGKINLGSIEPYIKSMYNLTDG